MRKPRTERPSAKARRRNSSYALLLPILAVRLQVCHPSKGTSANGTSLALQTVLALQQVTNQVVYGCEILATAAPMLMLMLMLVIVPHLPLKHIIIIVRRIVHKLQIVIIIERAIILVVLEAKLL